MCGKVDVDPSTLVFPEREALLTSTRHTSQKLYCSVPRSYIGRPKGPQKTSWDLRRTPRIEKH